MGAKTATNQKIFEIHENDVHMGGPAVLKDALKDRRKNNKGVL
jgi:hypothetical protein